MIIKIIVILHPLFTYVTLPTSLNSNTVISFKTPILPQLPTDTFYVLLLIKIILIWFPPPRLLIFFCAKILGPSCNRLVREIWVDWGPKVWEWAQPRLLNNQIWQCKDFSTKNKVFLQSSLRREWSYCLHFGLEYLLSGFDGYHGNIKGQDLCLLVFQSSCPLCPLTHQLDLLAST